jgi:ribonuclease VapC
MSKFVLDASALLALIQAERGTERVIQALEAGECVVSVVNLSEAMAKLIISGLPADQAEAVVMGIPVQEVPCDTQIAVKAAHLAAVGKPLGLSLGDRVCLATAQVHGGTVLTTEQEWRKVHLDGVLIEVIRDKTPAGPKGRKPKLKGTT